MSRASSARVRSPGESVPKATLDLTGAEAELR